MIGLHRFEYNGYSSQDFDLLCDVAFDSDEGESSSYLNREAIASETYNGSLRRIHNFKYSEIYAPTITLVKNDFDDFTDDDVRRILSWLTSSATPKFLSAFYDDSDVVSFEILGAPTDITLYKLANNRVVGIVFTFESSAPYAFSTIQTIEKDITEPLTLTINCDSDEWGSLVYPKITITHRAEDGIVVKPDEEMNLDNQSEHISGTVYCYNNFYYWVDEEGLHENTNNTSGFETTSVLIANDTVGSKTIVKNDILDEIVVLDGSNRVVTSFRKPKDGTEYNTDRIFDDDFNWQWMPLTPGENTIKIIGNCTIKFEWREPRKIGF